MYEPFYLYLPQAIPEEDYACENGIEYRRIPGTARGYHFCYLDEYEERSNDILWLRDRSVKPVIGISPEGKEFQFKSRKEASEKLGIPNSGISSVIKGRISKTHNWTFKEGDYI